MSFVERSIILCPYIGGSTIGGSTVISKKINSYSVMTEQEVCNSSVTQYNEGLIITCTCWLVIRNTITCKSNREQCHVVYYGDVI